MTTQNDRQDDSSDPSASSELTPSTGSGQALRQRAEEQAAVARGEDLESLSPEAARRLLHDLRVHQIELEMQNEELRRAQEALEASRARYFDLYDLAPVGYLTLSELGLILEANLTAATLLGVARGALVKQPLTRFILPEDQDTYYRHRKQLFQTGERQVCELRMVGRDGVLCWVRLEATVAQAAERGVPVCRAAVSDITDRKQADAALRESKHRLEETLAELRETQEQMMHQERLAAVGQLAAGIAHDFNNILGSIVLYTQLSLRTSELSPTARKRLEIIAGQADHAADLVRQILDFGRRAVLQRQRLDLGSFLEETVALLERALPESVQIGLTLGSGGYTIDADPTRVQQVIVNLALNARDAMPDGGELHIAVSRVEGEEIDCVDCGRVVGGEWVQVEVKDSGPGIPPDVLPHIFEPFFTTRAPVGHGLGLAQVYGIVKQHEGHLQVNTEVGRGTTFRLYWPARPLVEPAAHVPVGPDVAQGEGQTILVVEDNAAMRTALVHVMEMLGYQVLEAANGREALKACEQHGSEISLVLSDWVMPVMGGLELVRRLEERHMAVKVLILTGHPLDKETKRAVPESVVGWVPKPPRLERLAEAVAQALGKSESAASA